MSDELGSADRLLQFSGPSTAVYPKFHLDWTIFGAAIWILAENVAKKWQCWVFFDISARSSPIIKLVWTCIWSVHYNSARVSASGFQVLILAVVDEIRLQEPLPAFGWPSSYIPATCYCTNPAFHTINTMILFVIMLLWCTAVDTYSGECLCIHVLVVLVSYQCFNTSILECGFVNLLDVMPAHPPYVSNSSVWYNWPSLLTAALSIAAAAISSSAAQ